MTFLDFYADHFVESMTFVTWYVILIKNSPRKASNCSCHANQDFKSLFYHESFHLVLGHQTIVQTAQGVLRGVQTLNPTFGVTNHIYDEHTIF